MMLDPAPSHRRGRTPPGMGNLLPGMALAIAAVVLFGRIVPAADVSPILNSADERFIREQAAAGVATEKLAELGAEKANGADVRALAARIASDLSVANSELETIASMLGVRLANNPIARYGDIHDQLVRTSGAEFDKSFLSLIVAGHETSAKRFEAASRTTAGSELKGWVDKTLPLFQAHLKRAKELTSSAVANGTTGSTN